MLYICELIVKEHCALLRGQVLRLQMELIEILGYDAIYCTIPTFMDDEFITYKGSHPNTVIVWLIPIHKPEADFIDINGWEKYEDILEELDPDLFSLDRGSVV